MDVKSLAAKTRSVVVQYAGDAITITYAPARITPRWEQAVNERLRGDWKSGALVAALTDVVVDWDVTDGGEPWPPTEEHLAQLPTELLAEVLAAIVEDQRPNARSGGSFGDG